MKKFIAILLSALLLFSLVACGNNSASGNAASGDAQPSDLSYVKEKGKLVVGITRFAPMDYQDENGEWIGFDADMAKAFAEYIGVDVEFIEIDWNNKVFELNNKNIDCVWNGMTLTADVKAMMDCSDAYCKNAQVVVVPADRAADYQTAEACKNLKFAVEDGSAGEKIAVETGFSFTEVQLQADAVLEVSAGTCDAAIIDLLMAGAMVGEGTAADKLTYTAKLNSEEYGVGFRKGSDMVAASNAFFAYSKANGLLMRLATFYGVQESII